MKLEVFNEKVIAWVNERNFFGEGGATLFSQYAKLRSEFGELSDNLIKGRDMCDDIGDCAVVAVIINKLAGGDKIDYSLVYKYHSIEEIYFKVDFAMRGVSSSIQSNNCRFLSDDISLLISYLNQLAELKGYEFEECLEIAYNDIKDRKGKFVNNTFVKESDVIIKYDKNLC